MVSFIQFSLPKLCMHFSSSHMRHLQNNQFCFNSLIKKWLHKCLDPREVKWTLICIWIKQTCLHFLMLMDALTKNVKVTVLWDVTPCSLVGKYPRLDKPAAFYPSTDRIPCNVTIRLQNCSASHPWRPQSAQLALSQCQVSQVILVKDVLSSVPPYWQWNI